MDRPLVVVLVAIIGTVVIAVIAARRRRARRSAQGGSAGTADAHARPPRHVSDPDGWLLDATRYFRRLGFFAGEPAVSDEELAARLGTAIDAEWGVPIDELTGDAQAANLFLVAHDSTRVYRAPSKYFYPGDDTYVEVVHGCRALAPSVYRIADVEEVWDGDRGPLHVRMTVGGQRREHTITDPKYFDAGIVTFLNEIAAPAPLALRVCDNHGMPDIIIALRHEDARRLTRERGWRFWDEVVAG